MTVSWWRRSVHGYSGVDGRAHRRKIWIMQQRQYVHQHACKRSKRDLCPLVCPQEVVNAASYASIADIHERTARHFLVLVRIGLELETRGTVVVKPLKGQCQIPGIVCDMWYANILLRGNATAVSEIYTEHIIPGVPVTIEEFLEYS